MKYISFTREDLIVLFASVYPFMMVVNYLLLGDSYFHMPMFLTATGVSFVIGTASWVNHIVAANYLRVAISSYKKALKRIMIQLPVYILLTQLGLCFLVFIVFQLLGLIQLELNWANYRPLLFAGLVLNIIATSFHEGLYTFEQWKKSLIETESLKKSNLQSQLDSLKDQISPHFLFNSLNCLSSLITTDPDRACLFLDELSKVYRYLLRANENKLIPLSSELQFVHSYFHLLKTRYGDGIELELLIAEEYQQHLIPPLTLQILLENAVKHNAIIKDSPLRIIIGTDHNSNSLKVTNNVQHKMSRIISNRIGLHNIATKYQLLNFEPIDIEHSDQIFAVTLPLINPAHESTHHRR